MLRFTGAVVFTGLALWICDIIYDTLNAAINPASSAYMSILSFIMSALAFLVLLGGIVWLVLHMQKGGYNEQVEYLR